MRLVRAECRKLLTVRSTYFLLALGLAIATFVSVYVFGYKLGAADAAEPRAYLGAAVGIVSNLILFIILVGALLITHEYRYNTILYTLTAANSRLKVLLAKILVISIFSVLATLLFAVVAAAGLQLGLSIRGTELVPQQLGGLDTLWRFAFFGWAYAMAAAILAFIIRNQVGMIVALIFLPGPAEGLLGMVLKENAKYLPFTALSAVLQPAALPYAKAALVVCGYLVVGLMVAALLFKRRDAN